MQSGQIDRALAGALSRIETLRLKADYAGTEIEPKAAEEAVTQAEIFVRTVQHEFGLQTPETESTVGKDALPTENEGSGLVPAPSGSKTTDSPTRKMSPEETRRNARENWLKNYYNKGNDPNHAASQTDSRQREEQKGVEKSQPERDAGLDHDPE
jgi:hypothetical protein